MLSNIVSDLCAYRLLKNGTINIEDVMSCLKYKTTIACKFDRATCKKYQLLSLRERVNVALLQS